MRLTFSVTGQFQVAFPYLIKKKQYDHLYIGKVNGEWDFTSDNAHEADEFIRQAKDSFKENANEDSSAKLTHFLAEHDVEISLSF